MFARNSIGLDIGSKLIKLVAIKGKRDTGSLRSFGYINTPEGTVENGMINKPEEVGRELGKLVDRLKLKGSKTISALSGQQVYTRLMTLPAMDLDDLRSAALYQATNFLPVAIDDVTADVYPVREFDDPDGQGRMTEVFFIAARKIQAENLVQTCEIAGLKLKVLEIEPLALKTLYEKPISPKVYGILNIGAQRSYLSIFQNERLVFLRSISFGCSAFYYQIPRLAQRECQLDDLAIDEPESSTLLHSLGDELTRSIDYFRLQNKDDNISEMIICGGCARIGGMEEFVNKQINVPTKLGNIEENLKLPATLSVEEKNDLYYDYPVALGLALRGGI